MYSILQKAITIFQKYLNSAEIGSVELALLSLTVLNFGWETGTSNSFKKAETNVCEEDSLFYSSSQKNYQHNWHLALEGKHSELLLKLPKEV